MKKFVCSLFITAAALLAGCQGDDAISVLDVTFNPELPESIAFPGANHKPEQFDFVSAGTVNAFKVEFADQAANAHFTVSYDSNGFKVTAVSNYNPTPAGPFDLNVVINGVVFKKIKVSQRAALVTFNDNTVATTSANFSGGDGSEAAPFIIATAEDLKKLVEDVKGGSSYFNNYFQLDADVVIALQTKNWEPIGVDYNTPFQGSFEGNGHKITGKLKGNSAYLGFFGYANNDPYGTPSAPFIQNLTIAADVQSDYNDSPTCYTGTFAGTVYGYSVLNCTASGNVKSGISTGVYSNTGGMFGQIEGTVENCTFSGTVIGGDALQNRALTGGLAGVFTDSKVIDCTVAANVTGANANHNSNTAGIVGEVQGGVVSGCIFTGTIKGGNAQGQSITGGIAGVASKMENCTVTNGSTITGGSSLGSGGFNTVYIGGIAGTTGDIIHRCLNEGSVNIDPSNTKTTYIGGITGAAYYNLGSGFVYSCNTNRGTVEFGRNNGNGYMVDGVGGDPEYRVGHHRVSSGNTPQGIITCPDGHTKRQ